MPHQPMSYPSSYIVEEDPLDSRTTQNSCGKCSFLQCSSLTRSMDVLSMIKHSIISDEENPIYRYFELRQHVASCGPEMVWKIFDANRIEDNKEASVFFFEKKIADKLHKPRRREVVSEILRREVQYLVKLKHPRILTVIHSLEECHNSLAFATEPVSGSLANYLGNYDRMPVPVPLHIKEKDFLELEIKYGILQFSFQFSSILSSDISLETSFKDISNYISHDRIEQKMERHIQNSRIHVTEALSYLHNAEEMVHRNVCPQSIIITKKGNWKLAGLGFSEKFKEGKEVFSCQPWSTKMPKLAQPNLNYISPEVQTDKKCSASSDIFSLGVTICSVYNKGQSIIFAEHSTQQYIKQLDQMTQQFGEIAHRMPMALVDPVEKMINKDTRYRPTAQLFSLLKYFHDPVVSCLQRLDAIDYLELSQQKADVYTNLIQVIPDIPKKVLYGHILTNLVESCLNPDTMFMALPALLALIDSASTSDYASIISPQFRIILNSPKPIQATVYLLDKLDIVLAKSSTDVIKSEIIPLVFNSLDSNSIQAQEASLGCIRLIKDNLDDNIMRSVVLPRAKSLFNKSDNIKMRNNALTCIDHVLDSLDKMIILDEVLPFLTDITLGQDAKIVMAVVGIYKHLLSDRKFGLTHNLIATKVMPPLIPQTVNPGLNMEQFSALMEVLRDMLEHIDRRRRDKMRDETVTCPIPQRGLINMQADSLSKDSRNYLTVEDAKHLQKSRTEYSFTSLPLHCDTRMNNNVEPPPIKFSVRRVPATPDGHTRNTGVTPATKHKTMAQNASGGSLDECLSPPHSEKLRRHSLVPPQAGSGPPIISLPSETSLDNRSSRRPSAQSLGPFTFSVSLFGDSRRSSVFSTDTRRSSDRLRRPSTQSVGILPIASFGEGMERPRKPSTHSLGMLPIGWGYDEGYYDSGPRRPSATSLGPGWMNDHDRRGSRGSVFGTLGLGDAQPQRRASFQALGESVKYVGSSVFGSLGVGGGRQEPQRRASFQTLGDSVKGMGTSVFESLGVYDNKQSQRRASFQTLTDNVKCMGSSVFGSLGVYEQKKPKRRASYQNLGGSMMQLFNK